MASATTTVNVSSATAPSANQALIATSSTTATWQTLDIGGSYLSDVSVSSPANGDILRYSSSTGKWSNSNTLTGDETTLANVQLNTTIVKTQSSVTQNTSITTVYNDGTDGYIANINNSAPYFNVIQAANVYAPSTGYGFVHTANSGTSLLGSGGYDFSYSNTTGYTRYNIEYSSAFQITEISITLYAQDTVGVSNINFSCYGSNSSAAYNDTGNDTTSLTLLGVLNTSSTAGGILTVTNTTLFQYVHIIVQNIAATQSTYTTAYSGNGIQVQHAAGGYTGLKNGTL